MLCFYFTILFQNESHNVSSNIDTQEDQLKLQFWGLFEENLVRKISLIAVSGPVRTISAHEMNRIADLTQIERSTREEICY